MTDKPLCPDTLRSLAQEFADGAAYRNSQTAKKSNTARRLSALAELRKRVEAAEKGERNG